MIRVFCDAAFKPETLEVGLGYTYMYNEKRVQRKYYISQLADNHIAEFKCIRLALEELVKKGLNSELVTLHSDSQIVMDSIDKAFVKNDLYKDELTLILNLINQFSMIFCQWIPESQNRSADHLARQALKKQGQVMKLNH